MYYFEIDEQGTLFFAAGEYMPPPDRLKRIRNHVANDGAALVKLLKDKKLQATFGDLRDDDTLQRPPKGFDADQPYIELIKHRHFMVHTRVPIQIFQSELLTKTLVSGFNNAYKLVCWLRKA
jgi:uncharacterized protein (TIGR02453 family)